MKVMFQNRKSLKALQAAFLAVAVCFSIGATDATARYDKLSHEFMCSCGCGQVLGECNHVGCPSSPVQLAELKTDMANGMGNKEIMDSFAAKYGATVLAAPTTTGFNLVAGSLHSLCFWLRCWGPFCWYGTGRWARSRLRNRQARLR